MTRAHLALLSAMPNTPAWKGRAGIADGLKGFLAEGSITGGAGTTTDVTVAGDYPIETGTFEWTITPKKGKPMTDKGKYLTTWHSGCFSLSSAM